MNTVGGVGEKQTVKKEIFGFGINYVPNVIFHIFNGTVA
jgi:hypothetical protein